MQCALKITCVFSVIIHQNIDAKSTENPATWRTARMHDLGLPICCCQNHIQKKHPVRGVLSFALTPRSGGLGCIEKERFTSTSSTIRYDNDNLLKFYENTINEKRKSAHFTHEQPPRR